MPKRKKKIIVIGGGLAGLYLAMKICERNAEVVVVSYQSLKRSHSVCAQGGINAAVDAMIAQLETMFDRKFNGMGLSLKPLKILFSGKGGSGSVWNPKERIYEAAVAFATEIAGLSIFKKLTVNLPTEDIAMWVEFIANAIRLAV